MRTPFIAASTALVLALAGCASGATTSRYQNDLDKLAQDCRDRGGILAPTGQQSGRPQADNVCEIRGGTGRAPSGG